jgi:copper chaperone CopZ
MERVTHSAPAMYADHHVLKVRETLFALDGVEDVLASSAWQTVIVSYDESKIKPAAIEEALANAGYAADTTTPILAQSGERFKDPAWAALGVRVTETNERDLQMSGEFRRY